MHAYQLECRSINIIFLYFNQIEEEGPGFLNATFGGAKQSPTDLVSAMSSPGGDPSEILQGCCILISIYWVTLFFFVI